MTMMKHDEKHHRREAEAKGFGLLELSDTAFERIRTLVYDYCGINLTEQKRSLVVGRLNKMLRTRGIASFDHYCALLEQDSSGRTLGELVNRISTNHTYFYRERAHFEFFRDAALPEFAAALRRERSNDLRIWCAGCATGEEPYMLVMQMMEYFGSEYGRWDAGVLATDISSQALAAAVEGIYPEERLGELPQHYRERYFFRVRDGWQVRDEVRREVTFRRFNLMNRTFPFREPFHAIFCRNVMIYFDQPVREALVVRFHRHTRPGGYLFIGHSESLGRERSPYAYVMPALYRRVD